MGSSDTVIVAVSVSIAPSSSVTRSPTVKVPAVAATKLDVTPVASSYFPSLSRSQAYVAMVPSVSDEAAPLSVIVSPSVPE